MSTPVKAYRQAYVEIINRCNRSCPGCPGRGSRPAGAMPTTVFRDIIKQIAPLVEKVYLHVLGEPLLHPEFPEIVQMCSEEGLPVGITTNGTCLTADHISALVHPIVRQVNLSLHNLVPDGVDPAPYIDSIVCFTRRAFDERPDLFINYRFWKFRDAGDGKIVNPDEALLERIAQQLSLPIPDIGSSRGRRSHRLINRLYLNIDRQFDWPGSTRDRPPKVKGSCHGMRSQFAILVDGTVAPCCLDFDGVINLGNCTSMDLNSILSSDRARAIADGFSKGNRVEPHCQTCSFADRFPT